MNVRCRRRCADTRHCCYRDEKILSGNTTAQIAKQFSAVAPFKYLFWNPDYVRADAIKNRMAGRFHQSVFWTIHPVDSNRVVRGRFWFTRVNVAAATRSRVEHGLTPPVE
jgi:hypothetical protein